MLLLIALPLASGLVCSAADRGAGGGAKKASGPTFERAIAPLLRKYCAECHGEKRQTAGIGFHVFRDQASVLKARDVFERVAKNVQGGIMPPKGRPEPTLEERQLIVSWIETTLSSVDCNLRDPGRVTVRRLNRDEYNRTIRDLIGVNFRPADDFPSDDVGYGFDNIGDVLSFSPLLLEKYLAAAEKIAETAVFADDAPSPARRFEAERMPETGGAGVIMNDVRVLHSIGEVTVDYAFPKDGSYSVRVLAYGQQAGTESAKMTFRLDGQDLQTVDVAAVEDNPKVYQVRLNTQAGKHRVAVAFINDYYMPRDPDPKNRDRNLVVDYLEIAGPLLPRPNPLPETHRRIVNCTHEGPHSPDCARRILREFARRAYRRPATEEEVTRLARIVQRAQMDGDSFERGLQLALQAILVSPHFLFRIEVDPVPNDPRAVRSLNDFELASRLSYFLWSSLPDERLFTLAGQGRLGDVQVLEAEARRMLKDPRSQALVDNFGGQWLQLRTLSLVNPDRKRFPTFDDLLRDAMRKETELFFATVMNEDRSLLEFIDARYTFLNERLAKHYGIPGIQGEQFRRVTLTGDQRGGVLTQASILTVTSNPTRTSPVKRGKWILEQIFGTPPPPPPPGVEELKEGDEAALSGTLRRRMEQHRARPACATCHTRMDPLGFAFENYDAVGAWRTLEGKLPIDASGELPDGRKFRGPAQLKAILKGQSKQFAQCLAEKMLTYALGRGLVNQDRCAVDDITRAVVRDKYRFSRLVVEVVRSDPFRRRRGDGGAK